MDFFLEIHNGECGLGVHFCDHQRDHGPSVLTRKRFRHRQKSEVRQKSDRIHDEEINKGESTLLISGYLYARWN